MNERVLSDEARMTHNSRGLGKFKWKPIREKSALEIEKKYNCHRNNVGDFWYGRTLTNIKRSNGKRRSEKDE